MGRWVAKPDSNGGNPFPAEPVRPARHRGEKRTGPREATPEETETSRGSLPLAESESFLNRNVGSLALLRAD